MFYNIMQYIKLCSFIFNKLLTIINLNNLQGKTIWFNFVSLNKT